MHDRVELLDDDDPPRLRAGISAGEVAREDDDWFGTPVVEAARLCAAADAGQTLVTEVVRSLVGSRGGHQFRSVGALSLKGLSEPLPAAAVIRTPVAAPKASGSRNRRGLWPAVAAAIAVVGVGVAMALFLVHGHSASHSSTPPAIGYTPGFRSKPCDSGERQAVPDSTCGDLVVPEDRTKPSGRHIALHVWRAPARPNGATAADPTIDIGAFGILEDPRKSSARDHSDLIFFGTRISESQNAAMACPEFDPVAAALLGGPLDAPATIKQGTAALKHCAARLTRSGVHLARYNYVDAGDDVVDLIRALHLRQVNLVAQRDDIQAAFEVARVAPNSVRTLTLENPVNPGDGGLSDPTAELSRAFDHYVALCRAQPNCAQSYPDLGATVLRNDRAYDRAPRVLRVDVVGHPERVYLDGPHSIEAIANAVSDRSALTLLAAGIAKPPPVIVAQLAAALDYGWVLPDYPLATFLSRECSFGNQNLSPARKLSDTTNPAFAGFDDGVMQWECAAWPVGPGPAKMFDDFVSDVPTLIVQGELAWWATPQGTAHLQSGLSNSQLLTFPTLGGGSGGSGLLADGVPPCLNDLRRAFLSDPTQHLDTNGCASQSPRIEFVTTP
jgi:pimeloyl-ACP methyl ester carboxylesterase